MTNRTLRISSALLRSLAASALAAGALLAPSAASASDNWEVATTVTGGGDAPIFRNLVTIKDGGVLRVKQLGTSGGTGRLHIKASRIIISDDGVIDASGSGFRGRNGEDGEGMGGGKATASGGGGAFWGVGGQGVDMNCVTTYGAGGAAYGVLLPFGLGSAGGASVAAPGTAGSRGGHGGGSIILEAAQIEIYGKILAKGGDGLVLGTDGSGAGAGGEVRLVSNSITWGNNALVSVGGGIGGGAMAAARVGGSGGGGLIHVQGNGPLAPANTDISGGASPKGCMGGLGAGGEGKLQVDPAPQCLDLDGDGFPSSLCNAGPDCDDSDPNVKPGVIEKCDKLDNDCNGKIDDVLPDECGTGNKCQEGQCVPESTPPPDAGTGDAGPTPDTFEYRGGCALGGSGGAGAGGAGAALAILGGALAALRRARGRATK